MSLPGDQPGADVGPLISPEAKARVESLIQSGVDEGAKLLLDGRNVKVKGYENGNFVGPTILGSVTVRKENWDLAQNCGCQTATVHLPCR